MRKSQSKVALLKPTSSECFFCRSSLEDEAKLGKKYTKNGISIHYFCMLFASGLSQRGQSDRDGILGFLIPDIKKEARRAARLRCTYCKKPTASIGCVRANCRTCFHFGCGVDNGTLNQYYGNFASYCFDHRPYQQVPLAEQKKFRAQKTKCVICMLTVLARPLAETLRTPCCKANSWYHKDCLQRMASCSGLHFFKCPLCNNKDVFQKEMLEFGIYIPDRDAAWELEPNAFHELLERHNRCDVPECCCPDGRDDSKKNTPWEIVLCDTCGHVGCHVQCGNLSSPADDWVCLECQEIVAKSSSPAAPEPKVDDEIKPAKRRGRPHGSTSGYKRKHSRDDSDAGQMKRVRLSLSGHHTSPGQHVISPNRSKENYNDRTLPRATARKSTALPSKKTLDAAKVKSSAGRAQLRDLSYYVLGDSKKKRRSAVASDLIDGQAKPNISLKRKMETTVRTVDILQRGRGRRSTSCLPVAGSSGTDARGDASNRISSEARAQRARQRGNRDDEDRLIPNDSMPNWLKSHLKEDIFTGRNLGAKFLSLIPKLRTDDASVVMQAVSDTTNPTSQDLQHSAPSSRLTRSRRRAATTISRIQSEDDKPQWCLQNEFVSNNNNMGQKLQTVFPGLQLPSGVDSRLQPVISGDRSSIPSGRGKHCSSFTSGHPGSLPLGHRATFQTQVSGSELENSEETESTTPIKQYRGQPREHTLVIPEVPKERKNMKYWDFIQHLEDIGASLEKPSLLDRLSLYQQYLEGEFELLSFVDIKSAKLPDNDDRDAHSPTPSLVSPNDMPDDMLGGMGSRSPEPQDRGSPSLNPFSTEKLKNFTVSSPIHPRLSSFAVGFSPSHPDKPISPSPSMMYPYSPSQSCTGLQTLGANPALPYDEMPSSPEANYDDIRLTEINTLNNEITAPGIKESVSLEIAVDPTEPSQNNEPMASSPVDSAELLQNIDHIETQPKEPTEPQVIKSSEPKENTDHNKTKLQEPIEPQPKEPTEPPQNTDHSEIKPREPIELQPVESTEPLQDTDQIETQPEEPIEPQPVGSTEPLQGTDHSQTQSQEPIEPQPVSSTEPSQDTGHSQTQPEEPIKSQPVDYIEPLQNTKHSETQPEEPIKPPPVDSTEPLQDTDHSQTQPEEPIEPQPVSCTKPSQDTDHNQTQPEEPIEPQPVSCTKPSQDTDHSQTQPEEPIDPQPVSSTEPSQDIGHSQTQPQEPIERQAVYSTEPSQSTHHGETQPKKTVERVEFTGPSQKIDCSVAQSEAPIEPVESVERPQNTDYSETQPEEFAEPPHNTDHTEMQPKECIEAPPNIVPTYSELLAPSELTQNIDAIELQPVDSAKPPQNIDSAEVNKVNATEPLVVAHPEPQVLEIGELPVLCSNEPTSTDSLQNTSPTEPQLVDSVKLPPLHTEPKPSDPTEPQPVNPTIPQIGSTELKLKDFNPVDAITPAQNRDHLETEPPDSTDPPKNIEHTETQLANPVQRKETEPIEPEGHKTAPVLPNLEEDDCVIVRIEDVRTLRPSDPHHVEIEEIATVSGKGTYQLSQKTPHRPLVIKADEISTVPGIALIDLTEDCNDILIDTVVLPTKQKRCLDCGKIKMRRKNCKTITTAQSAKAM